MNRRTLGLVAVILVCVVTLFMTVAKQKGSRSGPALSDSVYNPYPPGILPSDLNSEIDRVLREVDVIEGRALARWHGLRPPIRTGQPPVVRDIGTEATETLGELMLFDRNISTNRNQACASCHMPYVGFGGPIPQST
jgi:cytochrome c peroxidase